MLVDGYKRVRALRRLRQDLVAATCWDLPKASTQVQLLEARGHLQRMLTTIPLTDDERAAVEDGAEAVERGA